MGLEDRGGRVGAVVRLELRPCQVRAAVERRGRVVVRGDPLLVVEELRLAQVATDAVVDLDGFVPGEMDAPGFDDA